MGDSLTVDLVLSGGHIDQEASEEAFSTALAAHIAERETQDTMIAEKVTELFETYKGRSIPMPTVGSLVAQKLNAPPEAFGTISERVLNYVRANSQTTGSEKTNDLVEHPNSLFVIGKGKGGGVYVRADRPAPAPASK